MNNTNGYCNNSSPFEGFAFVAFLCSAAYSILTVDMKRRTFVTPVYHPYIAGLATGHPQHAVSQEEALAVATKVWSTRKNKKKTTPNIAAVNSFYTNSRISRRFMAIPDFTLIPEERRASTDDANLFQTSDDFQSPIHARMKRFHEAATPIVVNVCRRAIAKADVPLLSIGKVIVATSTGFSGPSLDFELIAQLGLSPHIDRVLVGFMGCAAAMNALRIAMDFVLAHPGVNALVACVELSSIHTNFDGGVNEAVLHAIFADGVAACVVTASTVSAMPAGTLALVDSHSWILPDSKDGICLSIEENGISCKLSKELPHYIRRYIAPFVSHLLGKQGLSQGDVDFWAAHPGGRRIIEAVQSGLEITEKETEDSWVVLDQYGNMLSPSVLFVLERIFNRHQAARAKGEIGFKVGMGFSFSPGVGIEGILFRQLTPPIMQQLI